jgi:hypothetical protein
MVYKPIPKSNEKTILFSLTLSNLALCSNEQIGHLSAKKYQADWVAIMIVH